jgi:hypothetical protein
MCAKYLIIQIVTYSCACFSREAFCFIELSSYSTSELALEPWLG